MSAEVATPNQEPCTIVVHGFLRYIAVVAVSHRGEKQETIHDVKDLDEAIKAHLDQTGVYGRGIRLDDLDDPDAEFFVVPGVIPGTRPDEVVVGQDAVAYSWDPHRYDRWEVNEEVMRTLRRLRKEGLLPVATGDLIEVHLDLDDPNPDSAFDSIHGLWCAGEVVLEKENEADFETWVSLPDDDGDE